VKRQPLRGDELPEMVVPPPGPRSRAAAKRLRRAEGAAIWGADPEPIVWSRARGSVVLDLDGNRYVDLTSGFGAASLGHAAPEVARGVAAQARRLTQGLGDLQPHEAREKLVRALSRLGGALSRVLLASTGSEAVELALKTAVLRTGRRRVVAFEGAYHGETGAALEVTHFPAPTAALLPSGPPRAIHIPYPDPARCMARRPCDACDLSCLERGWETVERELRGPDPPGAVIVEPIQGRAGVIVPPAEFLVRLRAKARSAAMITIWDEILTGAGRTGPFWAWERSGADAEPDLMTAGKGLGGGVAIGALFGLPEIMEVWSRHVPPSGEAPYASTFYGHPLACAGALAALKRLTSPDVRASVRQIEGAFRAELGSPQAGAARVRIAGALAAVDGRADSPTPLFGRLLARGIITVPGGLSGTTCSLLPAFTIEETQLRAALTVIGSEFQ
jgi:4-aminobutyrate aminotransferase/(S)-3-amino-2-methylpropionate transaminase